MMAAPHPQFKTHFFIPGLQVLLKVPFKEDTDKKKALSMPNRSTSDKDGEEKQVGTVEVSSPQSRCVTGGGVCDAPLIIM